MGFQKGIAETDQWFIVIADRINTVRCEIFDAMLACIYQVRDQFTDHCSHDFMNSLTFVDTGIKTFDGIELLGEEYWEGHYFVRTLGDKVTMQMIKKIL